MIGGRRRTQACHGFLHRRMRKRSRGDGHAARASTAATLVLAALLAAPAGPATAETLPISCRPCRSATDVILMVGLPSEDYRVKILTQLWIEKHSLAAQQHNQERAGEKPRIVTRLPADLSELRREVQQIADGCARIKYLGIISHGNVGYLQIGRDGVTVRGMDAAFGYGFGCAMSPNASVEIAGCNIGRGCSGAEFMSAAATRLLPEGGRIIASQYYVFGNAFFGVTPRSIGGERELQVGVGGAEPRWPNGAEPSSECAAGSSALMANDRSSRN